MTPPEPFLKLPPLQHYELTFEDGSKRMKKVVSNLAIAIIVEHFYLEKVQSSNLVPHTRIVEMLKEFPAKGCRYSRKHMRDFPQYFLTGKQIEDAFTVGIDKEKEAWEAAALQAQQYLLAMKAEHGAATLHELENTAKVSNIQRIGSYLPPVGHRVANLWIAMGAYPEQGQVTHVVPVIAEQLSDGTMLVYQEDYLKNKLLTRLHKVHRGMRDMGPTAEQLTTSILSITAEDILQRRSPENPNEIIPATLLSKIPISPFEKWRDDFMQHGPYCVEKAAEPQN